jgi:uncharacterized membrane protein (DUF485 family)
MTEKGDLSVVAEKMDESELYGIMGWASVKAFVTMALLFLIGYFVLPVLIGEMEQFMLSHSS